MTRHYRAGMMAALCLGSLLTALPTVVAQSGDDARVEYPLQVINAASIDRLMQKAEYVFTESGRPEMLDVIEQWLHNSAFDLKGMDRSKSCGMMIYIRPGLNTGFDAIMYVPVTNADDFLATLAHPKGTVHPISGKTGRWEVMGGASGDKVVRQVGDYLFFADRDNDESQSVLDRNFPDVQRLVGRTAARYDLSYSLLLKNIPPAFKTLFMEYFKNQALAGLQQRDDEPDAAYRVRRANGESLIDFLDKVVNQGEDFTVGGLIDPENHQGVVELELNGTKDSKFAKFFQDMAGRRSYFSQIVDEPATLSVSISWQLDDKQRKVFSELFRFAPQGIADEVKNREGQDPEATKSVLSPVFKSLLNTADNGHLDAFFQISGQEPGDYRIVAGVRVLGGQSFPDNVAAVLNHMKANAPGEFGKGIELNVRRAGEFAIHKLPVPPPRDSMGQTMFGENGSLYLLATPQALWAAYGGDSALERLERQARTVAQPEASGERKLAPPFQLVSHSRQWIDASIVSTEGATRRGSVEAADKAFTENNDELRIIAKPTDSGVRFRAEFQKGYLDWTGQMIGGFVERNMSGERPAAPARSTPGTRPVRPRSR